MIMAKECEKVTNVKYSRIFIFLFDVFFEVVLLLARIFAWITRPFGSEKIQRMTIAFCVALMFLREHICQTEEGQLAISFMRGDIPSREERKNIMKKYFRKQARHQM